MAKREYGGYIEFESFRGELLHKNALALNCGRNALAYLCEAKRIKKLYLPRFLCSSIPDVCKKIGVEFEYYHIDRRFLPCFEKDLQHSEYLYVVNFYGQLSNENLLELKKKYCNIIVDQAQSYYQMPLDGVNTFYTCRKYFGVADGGFLYTDTKLEYDIPLDESFERMNFLLGRYERSANEFYSEYVANNMMFANEPVKRMSALTHNLLCGIDYQASGKQRKENFTYLHECFKNINRLSLTVPFGAFMYPLFIEDGRSIRKKLLKDKVYIPTLWPNVFDICAEDTLEYRMAADILPIPVDQRYDEEDMEYLVEVIKKCIN